MDLYKILGQIPMMTQKFEALKNDLAKTTIVGESGAGMVQITFNGLGEALKCEIDDDIYQQDKTFLQDLIISAINDGRKKREHAKTAIIKKNMNGLNLPPGIEFPFSE